MLFDALNNIKLLNKLKYFVITMRDDIPISFC